MPLNRRFLFVLLSALALAGCNSGETTITQPAPQLAYTQIDRLGRPLVNELFAVYARHDTNNRDQPSDDASNICNDIQAFMTGTNSVAQRSSAIASALTGTFNSSTTSCSGPALLIPDVIRADISKQGPATYFGIESNGMTGGTYGGRSLTDDVVTVTLGLAFGTTVSQLGLAQDDGNANLAKTLSRSDIILSTDNVTPLTAPKHYQIGGAFSPVAFPYVGAPQ